MEATEIRSARPMPEMILRITETGREITDTPEAPANRVDLADIRAWRFFRASPAEFLEQYGRDFCIDHIHAAFEVLTEAVKHLDLWHTRNLTLSGHIGSRRLTALRKTCDQRGIRLTVTYLTAPRALTFDAADASLRHAGSCGTALLTAGIGSDSPLRATPSVYWSAWFHRFFYDEVLPVLRVRDPGTFFSYLKVLSDYTTRGMNWAGIGTRCGISGPARATGAGFLWTAVWWNSSKLPPLRHRAAPRCARNFSGIRRALRSGFPIRPGTLRRNSKMHSLKTACTWH